MNTKEMEKEKHKKPKTRTEKILSVASSVLLVLAILFCGFVMMQIMRDGYVTIFGYSVFHVVSDSMEPTIPVGTLIISQRISINDIKELDIITFRSLESYMLDKMVTHRVVGIEEIQGKVSLRTRGDNNNSEDGHYVTEDNLVGRVVYQTPSENIFKKLYEALTTKMGFFSIVIIPVALLATVIMRENVKRIKREIANIKREVARMQAEGSQAQDDTPDDEIEPSDQVSPLSTEAKKSEQQEAEK